MRKSLRLLLLAITSLSCMPAIGQHIHEHPQRTCATMEQDSLNRLRYPQRGSLLEFEHHIQQKIKELQERDKAGRTKAVVLNIPIIVHIVHNGEAVGTGTNLSQEQVRAQIEVLNEDFRKKAGTPGFNNHPSGADIEIEFCLSPVDRNGATMTEPGIHRYHGGRNDWTRDQIENILKPTTIWDPNKFYNIWTVRFASSDANLLGYAQFPDQSGLPGLPTTGPAATDGVVVRFQSFGSADKGNFPVMQAPFNKGRTLTHETGHWLGLRHIWGDGNCADDFVSDTPPAAGPSSGCPVGRISCGGVNMVENYMDYSNDACMNIFTEGQKTRMRAVMEVSPRRRTLIQQNLCNPVVVDAPKANFTIDQAQCVLKGSEVRFIDLSTNFPTQWQWTFEGGDPSTSTERSPKVRYSTAGEFSVTLIAINAIGRDTLIIEDFINVSDEGLCRQFSNFEPSFTPTVLPLSDFGNHTGYLTGHNSQRTRAFSEFFLNTCGYTYISGAKIWFGNVTSADEAATVAVTVWGDRGPQGAPAPVIERKEVLVKQILDDVANNRPTVITFDRETPLARISNNFHVGVEINYDQGYSLAVQSSANGQATQATSWVRRQDGRWELFTIEYGANIAMRIEPMVGMNPSVQVSASKTLVNPGEEVILNGRGASIFLWDAEDGSISKVPGPQIAVRPNQTTTYVTIGSGLELCYDTAYTTIYTREGVVPVERELIFSSLSIYPNPGNEKVTVSVTNSFRGQAIIHIENTIGMKLKDVYSGEKNEDDFVYSFNTEALPAGMYLIRVKFGEKDTIRKWVKK